MIDPHSAPLAADVSPDARPAKHLTWDSREVNAETAFAALAGERAHGNRFLAEALARGAPFVLTDQDVPRAVRVPDATAALRAWGRWARDRTPAPVIGITGSAGKTTAKAHVTAALAGRSMPVYNTLNAIACFLLQEREGHSPLVVELGIDRVGEMAELMALVAPDVGAVTAVGEAHLEAFGSLETIAREKGGILRAPLGLVGVRAGRWFPGAPTYGFAGADFAGEQLKLSPAGASFVYRGVPVRLSAGNEVRAEAAVLGLALAGHLGLDLKEAAGRLAAVEVPPGRFTVHPGPFTVIDDAYNANPLSVRVALDALSGYPGRSVAVLGRMLELGPQERALHAEVGAHARKQADLTFGVGAYAAELGEAAYSSTAELLPALLAAVRPGDTVLVKASRGLSWSPERRAREGVGLDDVVTALLRAQGDLVI